MGLLIVLEGHRRGGQVDPGPGPPAPSSVPRDSTPVLPRADPGPLGPRDQALGQGGRLADPRPGARPFPHGPPGERGPEHPPRPRAGPDRRHRPILLLDHRLPGGQGDGPGGCSAGANETVCPPAGPGLHPRPGGGARGWRGSPAARAGTLLFEREGYLRQASAPSSEACRTPGSSIWTPAAPGARSPTPSWPGSSGSGRSR